MQRLEKKFKGESTPGPLYQLYRNSCHNNDGTFKKDLRILGRDHRFV